MRQSVTTPLSFLAGSSILGQSSNFRKPNIFR